MPANRPVPSMSYAVDYSIHEVVDTADQARSSVAPIKGDVMVREAMNRTDAAAQALRDLADAGVVIGRYEEIRITVKEGR